MILPDTLYCKGCGTSEASSLSIIKPETQTATKPKTAPRVEQAATIPARPNKAAVIRARVFRMLNLLKTRQAIGLKDFREEDATSFEIITQYTQYDHRTWLKYELNNDGSAVRLELSHLFGSLDFAEVSDPNQLLTLLAMNIPSFQSSSAYIGARPMNGTWFVSLNATSIFLTKWSDEDIADAFSIQLFDLVTGLLLKAPRSIEQFGVERE